jgi:hypothetical protein
VTYNYIFSVDSTTKKTTAARLHIADTGGVIASSSLAIHLKSLTLTLLDQ